LCNVPLFWTGPAWRFGLCAKFNHLTSNLLKENKPFPRLEANFNRLNNEYKKAFKEGVPFYKKRDLQKARTAYEASKARIDLLGHSWQATYIYMEMAKEIAQRSECQSPDSGLSLVSMGSVEDFDFALKTCHHSELLATVLATGNFFPGASQPNEANADLCRMLDQMLFNNGIPPLLMTLDEEEAGATALEIYKLLKLSIRNEEEYKNVLDCKMTLESLGFDFQFEELLRGLRPFRLVTSVKQGAINHAVKQSEEQTTHQLQMKEGSSGPQNIQNN